MQPHNSIDHLQQVMIDGGEKAFDIMPMILKKVIEKKLWRDRMDQHGRPFQSFEQFANHPLWEGLECSIKDLIAFCVKRPDVQDLIRAEVDPERRHGGLTKEELANGGDNITSIKRGTSEGYTLKRLKRDRPDLFVKVIAHEMSANAAAIEAGFRKKTFTVPAIPDEAAKTLHRRLGEQGTYDLIYELQLLLA